jgi:hypothetical protein
MKKILLMAGLSLAGIASAETLGYTFENPANISGAGGIGEMYTAPDVNTFSGVTAGNFTMTDKNETGDYSRFANNGDAK